MLDNRDLTRMVHAKHPHNLETGMKCLSALATVLIAFTPLGQTVALAQPAMGHCPRGLAKKNPPCSPPEQVGKNFRIGDR